MMCRLRGKGGGVGRENAEPTWLAPNARKKTRRDCISAGVKFSRLIRKVGVEQVDGYPTHRPIVCEIDFEIWR